MSPSPLSAAKGVLAGVRQLLPESSVAAAHTDPTRWRSVTVLSGEMEVSEELGRLARLSSVLETRIEPAPADRGVEVSMRARAGAATDDAAWGGEDPAQTIREELRRLKQRLETGEVLKRDPQPEGRRSKTPTGAVVDKADASAGKEGVL